MVILYDLQKEAEFCKAGDMMKNVTKGGWRSINPNFQEIRRNDMERKSTSEEMIHEKSTTNKERFKAVSTEGSAPVLETIYLPKWWVGDAKKLLITVEVIE